MAKNFFSGVIIFVLGVFLLFVLYELLGGGGSIAIGKGDIFIGGFNKLQPISPTIKYEGTNFTIAFTNALGTTVTIDNVVLTETMSNQSCMVTPNLDGSKVRAGGTLMITSIDCPAKTKSDRYNVAIEIQYNATLRGPSQNYTEVGYIEKRI